MEELKTLQSVLTVEKKEAEAGGEAGEKKPFFQKEASCPVCKEVSEHLYLRDRSYSIVKREDDYFISEYKWLQPEYNAYNLHVFGVWHCPHCRFTDDRKMFYQTSITEGRAQFDYVKKALLKQREKDDPFLHAVTEYLRYPSHDLLNALTLSILAVYVHSLPEPLFQNTDKIAKHYLRAAWLFRVCAQKPDLKGVEKFLTTFNVKIDRLQANVMNTLGSLEEVNECILDHNRELPEAMTWLQHWNRHFPALNNNYSMICGALDKVITTMRIYTEISEDLNERLEDAEKTILETPFPPYEQYQQFLENLQQYWPDVPLNEKMALEKAAAYFLQGLNSRTYELDMLKKLRVYELVIVLTEKSGEFNQALEICEQLEKLAVRFQKRISERLRKQEIIKDETVDPNHLNVLLKRCQEVLRTVTIRKKRIHAAKVRRDELKVQSLFGKSFGLTEETTGEMQANDADAAVLTEEPDGNEKDEKTKSKRGLFDRFRF